MSNLSDFKNLKTSYIQFLNVIFGNEQIAQNGKFKN